MRNWVLSYRGIPVGPNSMSFWGSRTWARWKRSGRLPGRDLKKSWGEKVLVRTTDVPIRTALFHIVATDRGYTRVWTRPSGSPSSL